MVAGKSPATFGTRRKPASDCRDGPVRGIRLEAGIGAKNESGAVDLLWFFLVLVADVSSNCSMSKYGVDQGYRYIADKVCYIRIYDATSHKKLREGLNRTQQFIEEHDNKL